MQPIQNNLLLKALMLEELDRPPVWMMRQAGRYLPEYMRLRDKYDFFTRIQTPELASEITLQPVKVLEVDAAIIFSDILVVLQAMGVEVKMEEGKGPLLPEVIRDQHQITALATGDIEEKLSYVFRAIEMTKRELNGSIPLIGFAGAPFTLLCYLIEGSSSKAWGRAKQFCFSRPELAHRLLQKITKVTISYLKAQVKAGADVVQLFDSWSGVLSPDDFRTLSEPYLLEITEAMKGVAPIILFPKGSWYALKDLSESSATGVGIDWCISPAKARELTSGKKCLQGNFDPAKLLLPVPEIKKKVREMIREFGVKGYIVNLGHGITPDVPVDHARAFVDAVKEYRE